MQELSQKESQRRIKLAQAAKTLVLHTLPIEDETDTGLLTTFKGFYLQVDFSFLHPLMVIAFLRKLDATPGQATLMLTNQFNQNSIIGCHTVNAEARLYSYRAAHWLDTELTETRFHEILNRCFYEVCWAYSQIHGPHQK